MRRTVLTVLAFTVVLPLSARAQDREALIKNALSAAPPSIADNATVKDWELNVLREGTNGWTCFPDYLPERPGNSPMCLDDQWLKWVDAFLNKTEPVYDRVGFGYMLQEGEPGSNTDPYATGPTPDNEWIDSPGSPHLMLVVPDPQVLEGLPTDPHNGGPWVMWRDTPLVHVMIPAARKPTSK